jgi:hypothetical protein
MKTRVFRVGLVLIAVALSVLWVIVGNSVPAVGQDPASAQSGNSSGGTDPQAGSDANGPMGAPPPLAPYPNLTPQLRQMLSTSHVGLYEEPAPGGGMMVNLQGRFMHLLIATTDANGNQVVQCISSDGAASAICGTPAAPATPAGKE